jgi:hypothetical protein
MRRRASGDRDRFPFENPDADEVKREHAKSELSRAGMMLDLLQELLTMQDYTISQMGTFSKG